MKTQTINVGKTNTTGYILTNSIPLHYITHFPNPPKIITVIPRTCPQNPKTPHRHIPKPAIITLLTKIQFYDTMVQIGLPCFINRSHVLLTPSLGTPQIAPFPSIPQH